MNILVYKGDGVCKRSLEHTVAYLRKFTKMYDIIEVDAQTLQSQPWESTAALLVFPGGRDRPYQRDLHPEGIRRISRYVRSGGKYLGICAGAYFACSKFEFEIKEDRSLAFYQGIAIGSLFGDYVYGSEKSARFLELTRDNASNASLNLLADVEFPEIVAGYYNGGCFFKQDDEAVVLYRYLYNSEAAIVYCPVGSGAAVLSGVHFEMDYSLIDRCSSDLSFIVGQLAQSQSSRDQFLKSLLKLLKIESADSMGLEIIKPTELVIFNAKECSSKNRLLKENIPLESYSPLKTQKTFRHFDPLLFLSLFGKNPPVLIYGDVVTSTQTILEKDHSFTSSLPSGSVFVAGQQIQGRGRGRNGWVSSSGCLQFTLVQRLPYSCVSKMVFIQYIVSIALIDTIRNHLDLPVYIKWPNDIYYYPNSPDKSQPQLQPSKLSGILITSQICNDEVEFLIGIGINLLDTKPLMSISDVISCHCPNMDNIHSKYGKEVFLARFMRILDGHLQTFLQFGFNKDLKKQYLDKWLHTDQVVYLEEETKHVKIIGLSDDGFLMAQDTDGLYSIFDATSNKHAGHATPVYHRISGATNMNNVHSIRRDKVYYLQPDGNSFDMMKGLIKRKS